MRLGKLGSMGDGSSGRLILGDNLAVLRGEMPGSPSLSDECVDLVYLDPPFNSSRNYRNKDESGFGDTWRWDQAAYDEFLADPRNAQAGGLMQSFEGILDRDGPAAYLLMMAPRLIEFRRVLKSSGSLVLHCDPTSSHYLKLMLDQVFGRKNYLNEIVWHYGGRGAKAVANRFGRNHDVLLYYAKEAGAHRFQKQFVTRSLTPAEARARGFRQDERGRWFKTAPRGDYTDESVAILRRQGRIYETRNGTIRVKYFLRTNRRHVSEETLLGDTWNDIPDAMHLGKERNGYPTQKPLALLERVISATTEEGDLVLDPFAGSGTTLVAAERLGRRWIGIDSNPAAIATAKERLGM